jgi:ABC-type multidrug transport system fused ATPase/permease subunit
VIEKMNTSQKQIPIVEIGEASFDREVFSTAQPVLADVCNQLYRHVHQSLSFHNKLRSTDLVSRLISYVGLLQGLVVPTRAKALILVGMFGLIFLLNWRLALVALLAPWSRPCQIVSAQSQADGLCQGSRQFGQTLKIETYQSTKQANYENTQNPKYTKPNRFKNETFQ